MWMNECLNKIKKFFNIEEKKQWKEEVAKSQTDHKKEQSPESGPYDRMRRRTAFILVIGAIVCVGVTAFLLYDYFKTSAETEQALEQLRQESEAMGIPLAQEEEDALSGPSASATGASASAASVMENVQYVSPYAEAFSEYPDIQGWLCVEGMPIDYPILQREGDDEYYLYRNFQGKDDKKGSLILDEDSSVKEGNFTTNLLIHGHNMKDGSMFGDLDQYSSKDYFEEHRYMDLYTRDGEHHYEVLAVFKSQVFYVTDKVFKYYQFFQADTEEEFNDFYDNIKEMSLYDTGVTAEFGDKFLTLSTCAYHVEDGRFVVVAKEIYQ